MCIKSNTSFLKLALLPFVAAFAVACSSTPPSIDTSDAAEVSFDGLHSVLNPKVVDAAWALPGADLTGYTKIKLEGAGIEYRPGGESGRTAVSRSRGGPYEVTDVQKERFAAVVNEVFRNELAQSEKFELVEESGPDVLLVRGALLDVISYVPPETTGRVDVYLSSVGEATLILEVRDSITNAIYIRAVDRRAASDITGSVSSMPSSRATNKSDVRRMVKRWGRGLREMLETVLSGVEAD
jgi:hypothetical protein